MKTKSIRIDRDIPMKTRDGITLYADIYRPDDREKHPAILTRSPSSNFPRIDRNMNTGNPFAQDARGIPALQTVFHDSVYVSYIDLPVIPEG